MTFFPELDTPPDAEVNSKDRIDHILTVLQTLVTGPEQAKKLARMSFIEWVASIPGDSDTAREARVAQERVRQVECRTPAIIELEKLLLKVTRPRLVSPRSHRRGRVKALRARQKLSAFEQSS